MESFQLKQKANLKKLSLYLQNNVFIVISEIFINVFFQELSFTMKGIAIIAYKLVTLNYLKLLYVL